MWECLLGVRHRGCAISDTSHSVPNITIQNVSRANVPGENGRRLLYLRSPPEEQDAFETEYRNHDAVASVERVADAGGDEAYFVGEIRYSETNPSVMSVLNSNGVFHHGSIMVQEGIEHWLVYSKEKSAFQDLKEELEAYDNVTHLYRMVDLSELGHINDIQFGMSLSQLTSQQRVVFRTALELGYFDGNSDTTVSDIADEVDLHETTTWEHLDKATNTILTDVGSSMFTTVRRKEV